LGKLAKVVKVAEVGERLRAEDWEDAALEALGAGGLAAVSVQSLARTLGVTKGSFYWHFEDREALVKATLARWEESYTDRVIAAVAAVEDPRARLEQLLAGVTASKRAWRVHVALGAAAHEPLVASALARVTQRRVAYIEQCYVDLGMARRVARRRALLAYTTYVGLIHLRAEAAGTLPTGAEFRAYVEHVVETLVPR
jgi:AcrR family transcriptional regulator